MRERALRLLRHAVDGAVDLPLSGPDVGKHLARMLVFERQDFGENECLEVIPSLLSGGDNRTIGRVRLVRHTSRAASRESANQHDFYIDDLLAGLYY